MKYRIEINKFSEGYEYKVYRIKGDFEELVRQQSWYSMFKWLCILKAKAVIRRTERLQTYPIKVADFEYETK
jgi:hypothetical protein